GIALLAGAILFTAGARAMPPLAEATMTRTETVKYDPIAATTPEGAVELYGRLQQTAARVCSEQGSRTRPLRHDPAYEACAKEALEGAVRRVDIPMVSLLHSGGTAAPALASR